MKHRGDLPLASLSIPNRCHSVLNDCPCGYQADPPPGAAAQMGKTQLIPLNDTIALTAADASLTYQLAMADAIVYATALTHKATLVTSDADLASLPGVVYHKT